MPKSSSSEIRLRGVFHKSTAEMQQKMIYLKHKLPLNKNLMKKFDVPEEEHFKYHYQSPEHLLEDYKSYVIHFL